MAEAKPEELIDDNAKEQKVDTDSIIASLLPSKDTELSEGALNVIDSRMNAPSNGFPGDKEFATYVEKKEWNYFKTCHYDWWMLFSPSYQCCVFLSYQYYLI